MTLRVLVLVLLLAGPAAAQPWGQAQMAVEQWLQGREPQTQGLTLDVPTWVEDGAFVAVDLSLHDAEPPLVLSLLRSGEDDPRIARIELQAWEAPLRLSTRVRLPHSQQLIVLARDGRGRLWLVAQAVEVLSSSCLSPSLGDNGSTLGQLQAWVEQGQGLELRSLLRHPMETGRRPGTDSQPLPRHLPTRFEINGAHGNLLLVEPFEGLAANPYWRLWLPAGHTPLLLRWVDADGREFLHRLP
jgi:sulfur-oxidizing protein SoxY